MKFDHGEPIAIVGMGCMFQSSRPSHYWHNILHGVDAITEVPESRWESDFYDRAFPQSIGFTVVAVGLSTSMRPSIHYVWNHAHSGKGAEPDQMLALQVAANALTMPG